jgi:uncharacterized protein with von Willebrand factor type A (vWA) domain
MILGDARSGKLADNITGFARGLRRAGLPMDASRISLAIEAATLVGLDRKDDLAAALQSVLVSREQDLEVFEQMFAAYFRNPELTRQLLSQLLPKAPGAAPAVPRKARVQEALAHRKPEGLQSKPAEDEVQLDAAMTASETRRLHQADFQTLSASEYLLVDRLARRITLPLPRIDSRRTRAGQRGHRMDWANTLHRAVRHGGEVLSLSKRQRRTQPLPLLILVDISGSMERYARLLLAFLHQATRHTPRKVYAFGTHLTDLNKAFAHADTDRMLEAANQQITDFAGGTHLGAALSRLRQQHARDLVGRRTVVLLISDGLDTGDAEQLDPELQWLKRHSRSLLWLNPLLRFEGYAPLATGAGLLHRHAQGMLAIHNLARLEDLAAAMAKLLKI